MNRKHALYQEKLKQHLIKGGIDASEAHTAAVMAVKTLKKQGAGFQMGHAKRMAEWMLQQKEKVEEGTLKQNDDGTVYDADSGVLYSDKS